MTMLRVYDFQCSKGHVTEHFIDNDTKVVECHCGLIANRLIPGVRSKLDPFSGDFPSAADAWANRREDHMRKEQKHKENHGTYWIGKSGDDFPPK